MYILSRHMHVDVGYILRRYLYTSTSTHVCTYPDVSTAVSHPFVYICTYRISGIIKALASISKRDQSPNFYYPIDSLEGFDWDLEMWDLGIFVAQCCEYGVDCGVIWELAVGSSERDLSANVLVKNGFQAQPDRSTPLVASHNGTSTRWYLCNMCMAVDVPLIIDI